MASPGANIPVSNTYAQALAPNITLPGVSLSGMPETVSLLQGSIPQIPTSGILNFNPIQISEAGWNPPRAGADILGFVEKYRESKKKDDNTTTNNNGVEGASKMYKVDYYTGGDNGMTHSDAAKKAGVYGIKAFLDGSHKAWVEQNKALMAKHDITLTHTDSKGNLTGKYSSDDWADLQDKLVEE